MLHDVPLELHQALTVRAAVEKTTVAKAMLDAAARDLGVSVMVTEQNDTPMPSPKKYRDLSDIAGTWIEDPEFDAILEEQRRIDPEIWK